MGMYRFIKEALTQKCDFKLARIECYDDTALKDFKIELGVCPDSEEDGFCNFADKALHLKFEKNTLEEIVKEWEPFKNSDEEEEDEEEVVESDEDYD
ncbi:hypothetical protein PRIPAC_93702 [Pristionchus pacificus]|uniref:Uncharacterized protein n=1 Tax=Pristionchus pacificus TaxID=54126 RepID=A0A2A6BPR6_PRIPA|nr:hypothetical protein PRIPAC_93702 [Pristionchus pacificus]|eukprot:PDM67826.1 hypothetical protein PRIPAC_45870 [Pristionchus pacificus]